MSPIHPLTIEQEQLNRIFLLQSSIWTVYPMILTPIHRKSKKTTKNAISLMKKRGLD